MTHKLKQALINLGQKNRHLRPDLRRILAYLDKKGASKEVVTGGRREDYKHDAFDIIVKTYKPIGVPVNQPEDLFKYPVWWVHKDQDGTMIAFSAFKKTQYGLKAGLSGFDGSSDGKRVAVDNLRSKFVEQGIYGEVSHKVKAIALAAGAPKVPVEYVEDIIGKRIQPLDDGYSYRRSITNVGEVTKVLIGKPNYNFDDKAASPLTTRPSFDEEGAEYFDISDDDCDIHHHLFCELLA